jgi:putative transposase
MMQDIGRRYERVINNIHGRTGSLWNPVRAGMAPHPAAYPWSSHSHYSGRRANRLISAYPQYHALGASEEERPPQRGRPRKDVTEKLL